MSLGIASSESYSLGIAISFVAMAIIGGMGSLPGSLIGALFVTATPEIVGRVSDRLAPDPMSHSIWAHPFELQRIVYGAAIVVFILLQPDGLVGLGARFRAGRRGFTRRSATDAAA
jgi:branched-chain amino acid transport system permease protein